MIAGVRPRYFLVTLLLGTVAIAIVAGIVRFSPPGVVSMLLAIGAIAVGVFGLLRGWRRPAPFEPPAPERKVGSSVPGESVEDAFGEFLPRGESITSEEVVWGGLRRLTIAVLVRWTGFDERTARERVESGTWTDDPIAARYLAVSPFGRSGDRQTVSSLWNGLRGGVDDLTAVRTDSNHAAARVLSALTAHDPERVGFDRTGNSANEPPTDASESPTDASTDRDSGGSNPRRRILRRAVVGRLAGGLAQTRSTDDLDRSASSVRTTAETIARPRTLEPSATGHWWGVGGLALAAIGGGLLYDAPGLVLAGAVAIGYVAVAGSGGQSAPAVCVERECSTETPEAGDLVEVRTTVRNDGDRPLFDVRIVDGVPAGLTVVEGSPRLGTSLRPGERESLTYTVEAREGTHDFDPAMVIVGSRMRSSERVVYVPVETSIHCAGSLEGAGNASSIVRATRSVTGRHRSHRPGQGLDLHSVRTYRQGDPLNRIDWNRYARTGDLATIRFHADRASRLLLVIDTREPSYTAPSPTETHAVDRAATAASQIAIAALEAGDAVGIAGVGPTRRGADDRPTNDLMDDSPCYLPPSLGWEHRLKLQRCVSTHPQFSTVPPTGGATWIAQLQYLRRQLTGETQVVLFTPLVDRGGPLIARRLAARGHSVTVVSPDPTTDRTVTTAIAAISRRLRCEGLRSAGIPVVDWPYDESIDTTLARHATVQEHGGVTARSSPGRRSP